MPVAHPGHKWLAYNVANQPTKIVIGSSLNDTTPQVREEFRYDPDGRRYTRQTTWQEGGTILKALMASYYRVVLLAL